MKKKEEQKFELLEKLREAAKNGKTIVDDAIFQDPTEDVSISETFVKAAELETLGKLLEKVEKVETLDEARMLLKEDSIPIELVIMDQFWGDFQNLIYKLNKKQDYINEKEFER